METKVKVVKSIVDSGILESDIIKALSDSNYDTRAAVDLILNSSSPHLAAHKTITSTGGARISTSQVSLSNNHDEGVDKCEASSFDGLNVVKKECMENGEDAVVLEGERKECALKKCDAGVGLESMEVKEECDVGLVKGVVSGEGNKVLSGEKLSGSIGRTGLSFEEWLSLNNCEKKEQEKNEITSVKEEPNVEVEDKSAIIVWEEKKVLSGERSSGSIGRSGLSFEEWLSLNNSEKKEEGGKETIIVNEEPNVNAADKSAMIVKEENKVLSGEESAGSIGRNGLGFEERLSLHNSEKKEERKKDIVIVKQEPNIDTENQNAIIVKEEVTELTIVQPLSARKLSDDEYRRIQLGGNNVKRKQEGIEVKTLSSVVIENGDFAEEPDWLLVDRTVIMGLSTTKGRKLEDNEIVHFAFPSANPRTKTSWHYMSSKTANAVSSIVRFSTKRYGEIGRLPMEWSKCLVPLVNSSKVKVLGRCVAAPVNLQLMQEIMLYVSFYIHHSVFTEGNNSSWKLEPTNIDTTTHPLLTLFKLLKAKPSLKAEFTPEELDSQKRSLNLNDDSDESASVLPLVKRRKDCPQLQDHKKDEQAISESSLNKLVGAVDMYNLEEMEPPETLTCNLRPYQKQALYWMSELETHTNAEEMEKTLHPCWAAYRVCDERAPAIYVNMFSGEATTQFPPATQTARGGILADAMGLGKTVMTIALILARKGRGIQEDQQVVIEEEAKTEYIKNRRRTSEALRKPKGGTLIVCPMALLSQWKDELETHSKPDSISIFVHYGGDRAYDPMVIAEPDVVLTTYGVLSSAYKNDSLDSIFHRVEWHRVVLDEAHTIKSSKTQVAQASFALSSYCRWCLTGTPLQNNLEDLFSLLCFLHVEPWCNWAWWNKLIQKPYENGDQRGLKLVKAILRPLMLRRTKESKDKEGRPILVLPPTDIKVIECEQSEAEHDFYSALFKRSKVQFDQFVAQGKVLHNYANILELLLRLRQCCNHPFLVMSRGDTQEYSDLNKLARRFLQSNSNTNHTGPSAAYVEEVVEGLRNGENTECPICLESADDPVLTPCAHRMCRECLLSSWQTTSVGLCPICRQMLKKTDLITCPSGSRFRIDVEKNWTESSKISKLLDCLERIRKSGSGEKSIVFSQWTSFLDLLEIPLKKRKFGFLRFDGKLAQKQRGKVLHEFAETKERTVLLMSLKAGGVGLNLTAASNVFLMDPWWNPAVEEQAIMRIHRIGQKRTVRVRRFIVKDTVEERLQQVQARKQRMIAGALTDEEVRSARIEELKMLFR